MVYLLHFKTPYKKAGHYLGFTMNITRRLKEHRSRRGGSALTKVAGPFWLARVWADGDKILEKKMKNSYGFKFICPICTLSRGGEMIDHLEIARAIDP